METWKEELDNLVKCPPIGSPEWFGCIPPIQTTAARQLVAERVPVVVQPKVDACAPAFLVLFEGTNFIAGGFDDQSVAMRFAESWNRIKV